MYIIKCNVTASLYFFVVFYFNMAKKQLKPFKVWDAKRKKRVSVVACSIEELLEKGKVLGTVQYFMLHVIYIF